MEAVLQVVTDDDRRGAQVFAVDLGQALGRRGHDVRTVALAPGRVGGLSVPLLGRAPRAPSTLRVLRREMRRSTVVVAHGSTTLAACALAGLGIGVPIVYRNIGDPLYWGGTPDRRLRLRRYYCRMAAVVALWPGSAQVLTERFGVDPARLTIIPNGVPAARFPVPDTVRRRAARRSLGLPAGDPVVAYVGALTGEKSVGSALHAIAEVPDAHLLLAGDGPERAALEALAARVLPGRAHFVGATASPIEAFAAADTVVLPSLSEGMPGMLIEASLSGIPAVASDVGGVSEIVLHGRTGMLVPPGDASALAEALGAVLARASEYGSAARSHCLARFDIEVVADAWERLLTELVHAAGQPRLRS